MLLDGLVELPCAHAIDRREVTIENHTVTAEHENRLCNGLD